MAEYSKNPAAASRKQVTTLKICKTPHIIKIVQIQKLNKQNRRNTHHEIIRTTSSPGSQYN